MRTELTTTRPEVTVNVTLSDEDARTLYYVLGTISHASLSDELDFDQKMRARKAASSLWVTLNGHFSPNGEIINDLEDEQARFLRDYFREVPEALVEEEL